MRAATGLVALCLLSVVFSLAPPAAGSLGGGGMTALSVAVTVAAVGALAWCASRRFPVWAVLAGLAVALGGWSFGYAPLKAKRILKVADGDGGALPVLAPDSVIAILDRTGPRTAGLSLCADDCVAILRDGQVKGIFLPRYVAPDGGQTHGVIYSRTTFGHRCDEVVTPRDGREICIAARPATLDDVTHVLETRALGHGAPERLGLSSGDQLRLSERATGDILVQKTAFTARVPARLPLLGDPVVRGGARELALRPRTRVVDAQRSKVPLVTQFRDALERQRAGSPAEPASGAGA
ncbi:MAG: hypothetical protein AAF092_16975 [Pseudomonadota bacterium]